MAKAIRALVTDYEDGLGEFGSENRPKLSEKMDALEVPKELVRISLKTTTNSPLFQTDSFYVQEARLVIERIVIPKKEPVDLLPRPPQIVSLQGNLVKKYNLRSERQWRGPEMYLRILPYGTEEDRDDDEDEDEGEFEEENRGELDEFGCATGESNGSPYGIDRLPLLPD